MISAVLDDDLGSYERTVMKSGVVSLRWWLTSWGWYDIRLGLVPAATNSRDFIMLQSTPFGGTHTRTDDQKRMFLKSHRLSECLQASLSVVSREDQRQQTAPSTAVSRQVKERMSCSLTLQKFLPGGLGSLSDSRAMILAVKQRNIEAQAAIWMQLVRHQVIWPAGALRIPPGSSASVFSVTRYW